MNLSSINRMSQPTTDAQRDKLFYEGIPCLLQRVQLGLALLPAEDEGSTSWMLRVVTLYVATTGNPDTSWNDPQLKAWRESVRDTAVYLCDRLESTCQAEGKTDAE